MQKKNLNNSAFTLLEILLAAVIFMVSVAGVFATLNAVRAPVANKESQLAAAVFGKQVLEALYSQVENSTFYRGCQQTLYADGSCGDFSLSIGVHEVAPTDSTWPSALTWPSVLTSSNTGDCPGSPPCLTYIVTCSDNSACVNTNKAHRVDLNINWPSSTI